MHGYTNRVERNELITWVSKIVVKCSFSEFPKVLDINTCPRTIFCNTCELINMSGGILNPDGNVEDKDDYGIIGSFSKQSYYYR